MELPDRYPLAKASDEEVISWTRAAEPPFDRVREAVPWLTSDAQVPSYCAGIRETLGNPQLMKAAGALFGPALDQIRDRM